MDCPPGSPGDAERVWRIADARIDPEHGGVFNRGRLRIEAALQRGNGHYRGWRGVAPDNPHRLSGRHLYGGTLFFHFGHFLTESLSRLWAVADSGARSILFTPKSLRGRRHPDLAGWQAEILDRLGIHLPVRILHEAVEVEELLVPAQGFGLGRLSQGTPAFRAFTRKLRPALADHAVREGTKLYLSRSRLARKTGGILGEAHLEQALAAQGFTILHPQDHSIGDQLQAMSAAHHLLGPEGSAFHLAGLVAAPRQRFALIRRRSAPDHVHIRRQIRGMGATVAVLDMLAAEWLRPGKERSDDMSWGEPDYPALSARLLDLGLIARPLHIDPRRYPAEMDLIAQAHKGQTLQRVAVSRAGSPGSRAPDRGAPGREHLSSGPQAR